MPVVSPPDHNGSYDDSFIVVRLILFEKIAKIFFFAAILGHFVGFFVAFFFTKINTCIWLQFDLTGDAACVTTDPSLAVGNCRSSMQCRSDSTTCHCLRVC